jgi:flagellar biosynthesis anti-sigma factor FlgM
MEISGSRPPGNQGVTPGNVKKKEDAQASKDGTVQEGAVKPEDGTLTGAATAPPKVQKKDVNAADSRNVKVRNPQLDLDVHYSVGRNSGSDRVTISGKAKEINAIKSAINKLPDVRDDKVQKYRDAIEEDDYAVDSNAVSGRMLDEI